MVRRIAILLAAALLAVPGVGSAQDWPARPVRMIVSPGAGTPPDVILRLVSERLSQRLGKQFVVENLSGGGGLIASQAAARAAPDGYTFYLAGVGVVATDRFMFKSLPYDTDRDFLPVAILYDSTAFVLAVHPDVPARTVAELVAVAKAQPGKLSYGTDTVGVAAIPGLWFNKTAGTDIVAVPYKSAAQLVQDAVAGRLQVVFTEINLVDPYRKVGKLRVLGVSSARRFPAWEDVPTISETLPGYKVTGLGILWAPSGTPAAIVQRINREVDSIVRQPDYMQKLLSIGFTVNGAGTEQSIAEFIRSERSNWDQMLNGVHIEPQ
jgi:tripartite-type tricarboxylate transporter receptor subunit TctC